MKKRLTIAVLALLLSANFIYSQQKNVVKKESAISVNGTSTLHDWDMLVEEYSSKANFSIEENSITISKSNFSFKTEDMKSSSSGMNSKAYEALLTKKHPTINFQQNGDVKTTLSGNKFNASVSGILTIAGSSKNVILKTTGEILTDGTIKIQGKLTDKMSLYGVTPPKAMMGAIKSGDDITINFNVTYK